MSEVIQFPGRAITIPAHLDQLKAYTEEGDDPPDVVLISEPKQPGVIHVAMTAPGVLEVLASYPDTEVGRVCADTVGEAVAKAFLMCAFHNLSP